MVRFMLLLAALLLHLSCANARNMQLTGYDDGVSCPANCDAHVVMNPGDNATRYAHSPDSSRASPKLCVNGKECVICFGEADASCMSATYRGGGPDPGRFDFTPAFYQANCGRSDIPSALKAQCASLDKAAARLGYTKRTNCIATPTVDKCKQLIADAQLKQDADVVKRNSCLKDETAYNKGQTDPKEKRTNECNYSLLLLGGSGRKHWHLLLPAACRPGTYVDRFGLDCCSSDVRFAAANHPECLPFFPSQAAAPVNLNESHDDAVATSDGFVARRNCG
jgi:hypothetical protein